MDTSYNRKTPLYKDSSIILVYYNLRREDSLSKCLVLDVSIIQRFHCIHQSIYMYNTVLNTTERCVFVREGRNIVVKGHIQLVLQTHRCEISMMHVIQKLLILSSLLGG